MGYSDIQTRSIAAMQFGSTCNPKHPVKIIDDEVMWRVRPHDAVSSSTGSIITATRWRGLEDREQEVDAEASEDHHVIGISLRSMNVRFSVFGRTVCDGVVRPGMSHVAEPAVPVHCVFRGPYDSLHLHAPNDLVAECCRYMRGQTTVVLCSEPSISRDRTIERLGRALLAADEAGEPLGRLYADCISISIIARLIASTRPASASARSRTIGLAKWRLRRVIDYIEARLDAPVSLVDIASAAGLTRMHFAAQFRAATGLRPHDYLLRRRIARAQEMLVKPNASLADIALSVGFLNQSHFTSTFKRFVGQPPGAWRQALGYGALHPPPPAARA
jgi:AraC family transcriptional regulator